MIDIYNEVGHIADVLEKGFDRNKWKLDLALLVKFRKSQEPRPKKSAVKQEMVEKCAAYVPGFDKIVDRHKIEKLVEKTWNEWKIDKDDPEKSSKLRNITQIELSKEVLDWFLNLEENITITSEKAQEIQEKRKVKVKEHPINFNRTKILFTLFIWTKIQKNYMREYYDYHNIQDYKKKFRRDANLGVNYSIDNDLDILEDIGLINTTQKNTVYVKFMQEKVFKTKITDNNRIIISGQDLYDCGLWIKKQKYEYYVCENCRKTIFITNAINKNNRNGRPRKYCEKCARKIKNGVSQDKKFCVDCGKEIVYKNTIKRKRERCPECQIKFDNKKRAEYIKEIRKYQKV